MTRDLKELSIAALVLFVFAVMAVPAAALAFAVNEVRFGVHPDKIRMVFELSDISDFRAFTLADPYRLVIDLPEFDWNAGSVAKPPTVGISNVRQGQLKPGVSRVVFDLERPMALRAAFLLPRSGSLPDRLVVDFSPASPEAFMVQNSRILGTLNVGDGFLPQPAVQKVSATGVAPVPPPAPTHAAPQEKPLIVIDPGHGGIDPGAVGANKTYEKNVTLGAARELRDQLLATGRYRVKLTRETDVYLKLHERVRFARDHGADLFVSIHADSIRDSGVRGASIYTLSEKASDVQTAKLAERENRADLIGGLDLSGEDEEVARILVDLSMRETMNQSKFFANTLVDTLSHGGVKLLPNTHRYAGFAVLKAPDIPSVLVEIGFMSNASEARMLSQPDYRRKIAASLVKGIDSYFERVRRHQRT
ncbi:MAG: N-acetylmuramoyl-L-alanine amidase [Alphaproteobacteria bacterium]|nr:N-acetylmuramoyl-L-alanine amidase [Alphaproteobacteria bacterium]